ncbi:hypothetical protein JCM21900_000329 [Sporobolomyces salmonicolor]
MESLLSDVKLRDELEAFKATAGVLATQKLRFPSAYVPPLEDRPKKATLVNVPVCDPPSITPADDAAPSTERISLTIKSLKPPLTFSLSATPTATISSLKAQLSAADETAPPPEAQRWILKGKAMGDSKLLKEFAIQDGTVINLMVTKTGPATPSTSSPSAADPADAPAPSNSAVPALTLSMPSSSSNPPQLSLKTDLDSLPLATSTSADNPSVTGSSEAFLASVSSPELWQDVRDVVEKRFPNGGEAQKAWEAMFSGCQQWISPNQKALIRERVDYSAMGGV